MMSLRLKSILIVIASMIIVILSLWIVTETVLLDGFVKVENENTLQNAARVRDALNEITNNIEVKALDWSIWNDLYNYAVNPNPEFEYSNLTEITLTSLKLNFLIITDTAKNIIYSMQYHYDMDLATALEPSLKNAIMESPDLFIRKDSNDIRTGILMLDSMPALITSQPIHNSSGKGVPHGTIVFGSFFSKDQLVRLQQLTHISIEMTKFDNTLWQNLLTADSYFREDSSVIIMPVSKDTVSGYIRITDIHNKPVIVLKINLPRDVYNQGLRTDYYLSNSIIIAGIILLILLIFCIDRFVIRRISKLNADVTAIEKSSDNSARVSLKGNDELSHFASSVNSMLGALEIKDHQLRKRNDEMRLLMNTIPVGLLSIDENYNINAEYSSSIIQILQQDNIAGESFFKVFRIDNTNKELYESAVDYLDLMKDNNFSESDVAALNPCEEFKYSSNNCERWLALRFCRIHRGSNLPCHILISIEDMTDRKVLAQRVTLSEKENLQLKLIAEDPDLFSELLSELHRLLDNSLSTINRAEGYLSQEMVNSVFRDIHTIKGSAGPFGLDSIVSIASELEDSLAHLRTRTGIDSNIISYIQFNLSILKNEVHKVVQIIRELFGSDFNQNLDIHLRIPLERIKREFSIFSHLLDKSSIDDEQFLTLRSLIQAHFTRLRQVSTRRGLAKTLKTAHSTIKRIHKNVSFAVNGEETLIDCEVARYLNNPLIHLIRNCLDHGIEDSEQERTIKGKPSQGRLFISITKPDNDTICIELGDDGRGIDPDLIKQTAVDTGLITEEAAAHLSYNDTIAMIYRPGFSTSKETNDISGRGIGMDVVNYTIKEILNGQIIITSEIGKGTTFRITIPCSIQDILDINRTVN